MSETVKVDAGSLLLAVLTGANAKTEDEDGNTIRVRPDGEIPQNLREFAVKELSESDRNS
jgi:hypothetical protein